MGEIEEAIKKEKDRQEEEFRNFSKEFQKKKAEFMKEFKKKREDFNANLKKFNSFLGVKKQKKTKKDEDGTK